MIIESALIIFPVVDPNATAEFYSSKLGFRRVDYLDSKQPHVCLYMGSSEIILTKVTNGKKVIPNRELYGYGEDAYFITDRQEELQAKFEAAGVTINERIHKTDYGNLEFSIIDNDSRILIFGKKQWALSEDKIWDELYSRAKALVKERELSPFMQAAGVAAAILTDKGNIYTGVCLDTASTLGMCAERNAMANMITNGESKIKKVVAVMYDGSVGSPCGACREFMMQLDKESRNIEILVDIKTKKTVRLGELLPDWWGDKI
jgi:cytidine deaminase